jgi:Predicted transcriptional regulators
MVIIEIFGQYETRAQKAGFWAGGLICVFYFYFDGNTDFVITGLLYVPYENLSRSKFILKNNLSSGDRVKHLRKYLGLTQEAFGEALGMTHGNVSKIEKNEVSLSNAFLNAIKRRFACNPDWITTGEGEMFISPDEFITIGIRYLGVKEYGEGLLKILKDPEFVELYSLIATDNVIKENVSNELKELLQRVIQVWQQGDERTRGTLEQFVKAFLVGGNK